ncbi:hypothetical protein DYY67_0891 [Candidatus Nitrosotalea sp. TS]|uniref:hypothetical protein n=1 Tax=Candidatus Nitrosotalea sp. TS TaxID=2341020 RepID=UPI00140793DA|nr:hypothetical protein [Candidatus Nitrosotalea sp. TS]NHI03821.1 hypothetical protein [Candidatus Nitrosotalea sp. TS]
MKPSFTNLSSQVKPAEAKHTHTAPPPAPKPEPAKPRPAASGPTHGTLPAGFKAPPPPTPKEEPRTTSSSESTYSGEVSPTYAKLSSTGYSGNKYFATRPRLSYHPANKQFKGQATTTHTYTTTAPPPPPPAPEPKHSSSRGTLPAGTTDAEKKSMWKAKGAEYENYVSEEETHKAPPPAPKPSSSRGTLPAGFNAPPPPPAPKETPKPEPAKPRPAASGPTHGTLPAGFKAPPPPTPKEEPRTTSSSESTYSGEVSPTYAKLSSTGYSGNKYFATRPRLSYHPANKQFKGQATTTHTYTTTAPEPAKPKTIRGTLPAGFKP